MDHPTTGPGASRGPVEAFWDLARFHARLNSVPSYFGPTTLEVVIPPTWSFGTTAEDEEQLGRVLDAAGGELATALSEYEDQQEPTPEPGSMSILLDGVGRPMALLETTEVEVLAFGELEEEHARQLPEPAGAATPVVLERFRVLYRAD